MARITAALTLTAGLALAACGGGGAQTPPTAAPAKPSSQTAAKAVDRSSDRQTEVATAPATPPAPVNDDPQQFMGLNQAGVTEIIGNPALIRRDGPAEVWLYRGQGCLFDIFLYRQDDDSFQVRYVELRAPDLPEDKHRACLADIIRAGKTTPATG